MKKTLRVLLGLFILLLAGVAAWLLSIRANSDALWKIVSEQCVPQQQQRQDPAPCLSVNLDKQFVVFKDAKGPLHTLTMPTEKITGIESPLLQAPDAHNYLYDAWQDRDLLKGMSTQPLQDRYLALAVNGKYGRTQNQLHIHLACLREDVYQAINKNAVGVTARWQPLGATLKGHDYLAMRISANTFARNNPFKLLNTYVQQHGDDMEKYGLAMVPTEEGDFILLANRLRLTALNLGSAGELLDYSCTIAQ